jgi:hypothetical protein
MREMTNTYKILFGKPEGKRPFGRPRHRRKDNIRIHLREIVWEGVDRMLLTQDRGHWRVLVNMVMKLRVP